MVGFLYLFVFSGRPIRMAVKLFGMKLMQSSGNFGSSMTTDNEEHMTGNFLRQMKFIGEIILWVWVYASVRIMDNRPQYTWIA